MKKTFYTVLSCLAITAISSPAMAGNNTDQCLAPQTTILSTDSLQIKAATDSSVKVIVTFTVADIAKLTSSSTAAKSPATIAAADQALANTISANAQAVLQSVAGTEYTLKHTFKTMPFMAMEVSQEALSILQAHPQVISIIEDKPTMLEEPNIAEPNQLATPQLTGTTPLIGATDLWDRGYTGEGWYVAILDTGIRKTHDMFTGKTVIEYCSTVYTSDCPNGGTSQTGSGAANHYYDYSDVSGYDHGTHVAGIATGNNGSSIYGVAKNADIMAMQVFSKFTGADCGDDPSNPPQTPTKCIGSYDADQMAALEYVYGLRATYNIASTNLSLGGGQATTNCDSSKASYKTIVDNLRSAHIATAIATGNDGWCGAISSPACISTAFAIGASSDTDLELSFNNWSDTLQDFFAPGGSINSSTGTSDSSYGSWNGTSMATPHVAGAWALLREYNPTATVNEISAALATTGVQITTGCGTGVSKPRIEVNLASALLGDGSHSEATKGDLSGDGTADVLIRNNTFGVLYMVKMDSGTAAFESVSALDKTAWDVAGIGDITGDATADVLIRHNTFGALYMIETNGGSPTIASVTGLDKTTWDVEGVADLTGDGTDDILIRHTTAGVLYMVEMDSGTAVIAPVTALDKTTWNVEGMGDLTGDGTADILIRNNTFGVLFMIKMDSGTAVFASVSALDKTAWDVAGVGDLTGDGTADILIRHNTFGALYMINMDGATPVIASVTGLDKATWDVENVSDLTGDGKEDILIRHTTAGVLYMVKMDSGIAAIAPVTALDKATWNVMP